MGYSKGMPYYYKGSKGCYRGYYITIGVRRDTVRDTI